MLRRGFRLRRLATARQAGAAGDAAFAATATCTLLLQRAEKTPDLQIETGMLRGARQDPRSTVIGLYEWAGIGGSRQQVTCAGAGSKVPSIGKLAVT